MEMNQTTKRIHPLVAGAAASVMLVSLVGVAAITGLLPTSHGTVADNARILGNLEWKPVRDNLDWIIGDALAWERSLDLRRSAN